MQLNDSVRSSIGGRGELKSGAIFDQRFVLSLLICHLSKRHLNHAEFDSGRAISLSDIVA
jgi:hypothetical protein